MTVNKKPTDAEIIKALECCIDDDKDIDDACMKCPMICDRSCIEILHERLYKIINCQQAEVDNYKQIAENQQKIILDKAFENKKLKAEIERLKKGWKADILLTQKAKAEAYKEFANKLESELGGLFLIKHKVVCDVIDNILKELVGEDK